MSEVISIDRPDFKDLRDSDGYYRDGLEVLRRALAWIAQADDRNECEILLPEGQGAVIIEFNGGVPHYLISLPALELIEAKEITATGAVDFLEGLHQVKEAIPVDPALPEGFDNTPNEDRPMSHKAWFNRPYIVTDRWEPETWEHYRERLSGHGRAPDITREVWAEMQEKQKAGWFNEFPSGVRYDVRCLDGGAWDRPTWWGSFGTIEEAMACARSGPGRS